jgi:Flp pilus assembly protein TadB
VDLLFAIDRNLMRMYVILALFATTIIGLAFLAVCYARSRRRARQARRQQAVAERLNALVAQAEREHRDRKAAAKASAALTEVLPAIKQADAAPRRVA